MSGTEAEASETESEASETEASAMRTTTRELSPSTKVPKLKLVGVLAAAGILIVVLLLVLNDTVSLGNGLTTVVVLASSLGILLLLMAAVNIIVRIFVLSRTSYRIENDRLHKRFELFYRRSEREIPIARLRGVQFSQNALQNVFDYGTLVFLTAGPNRSLGFLEFEYVPDPVDHREEIRTLMDRADE